MKQYSYLLAWVLVGLLLTGCMSPQGRPRTIQPRAPWPAGPRGRSSAARATIPGPAGLVGAAVGAVVGGIIGHG